MKRFASLFLLILFAAPAWGQGTPAPPATELTVEGPGVKVVKVDKVVVVKVDQTLIVSFPVTVKAPPNAAIYFWTVPTSVAYEDAGDHIDITSAPKGMLPISVKMIVVDFDKKVFVTKFLKITLAVGDVPIPPVPPIPPDPVPPIPPVPPTPIPDAGLHVMIVYDKLKLGSLTPGQLAAIESATFRQLLESKCMVEPETKKKAYRIWPTNTPIPNGDLLKWQNAFGLAKANPWLTVSNGKKGGYNGPLPATLEETTKIINQFAD